ncbi:hypothetical protein [Bradyrhizobium sp. Ai1a-2]|uniref:hypothetical protein n=1 Tax=Bradyrhizobium sp. Ai1a-2 TaxID=196490 RepID=UPI000418A01B|nr:hypothetical protein [Bradyrhizobium sp. Ai1a-2]
MSKAYTINDAGRDRLKEIRGGAPLDHPLEELFLEVFSAAPRVVFSNAIEMTFSILNAYEGDIEAAVDGLRSGEVKIERIGTLQ